MFSAAGEKKSMKGCTVGKGDDTSFEKTALQQCQSEQARYLSAKAKVTETCTEV